MSSAESSSNDNDKHAQLPAEVSKHKSSHQVEKKKKKSGVPRRKSSSDWSSESDSEHKVQSRVQAVSNDDLRGKSVKTKIKAEPYLSAERYSSDSDNSSGLDNSHKREQVHPAEGRVHHRKKEHGDGKENRLQERDEKKQGEKKRSREHRSKDLSLGISSDSSDQDTTTKQGKIAKRSESKKQDHHRYIDHDKDHGKRSYNSDPDVINRKDRYKRDSERSRGDKRYYDRRRNIPYERRRSRSLERHRRPHNSPGRHSDERDRRRGFNREDREDSHRGYRDQRQHKDQRDHGRRKGNNKEQNQSEDMGGENWGATAAPAKEEPNFGLSGKLTEFTNTYKGVVIKYNEPPEARKPRTRWRLYPFKGDESLSMLHIHRQSAYLLGRDRNIADIPVDHPSCSKQHSVLQFRLVDHRRPDGVVGKKVKPYIIDLESTNGTYVNNKRIDPRRYVELMEKDVLKFGFSTREYVILHEKSKGDESSDEEEASPAVEKKS